MVGDGEQGMEALFFLPNFVSQNRNWRNSGQKTGRADTYRGLYINYVALFLILRSNVDSWQAQEIDKKGVSKNPAAGKFCVRVYGDRRGRSRGLLSVTKCELRRI